MTHPTIHFEDNYQYEFEHKLTFAQLEQLFGALKPRPDIHASVAGDSETGYRVVLRLRVTAVANRSWEYALTAGG